MRNRNLIKAVVAVCGFAAVGQAGAANPHHQFLGGPWEVLAKMGHEGEAIRLPLKVADENKAQRMNAILPVMATPIGIRIKQYLPNLKRDTIGMADPNGGAAAKLSLRGENLSQDLWLSARDPERRSISSHIGGVAIRELPSGAGPTLEKLTDPETVGILLIWLREDAPPLMFPVAPGRSYTLAGSDRKVSVLKYIPHYSIDRQTKEVTSLSDRPENPAILIQTVNDGQEEQQWLWSLFPSSPHKKQPLPFRARFLDFDLGDAAGQHILAITEDAQAYLFLRKDGQRQLERVKTGQRYPFNDEGYSFAVEEVLPHARIETTWRNESEMLVNPALVADIVQGDRTQEVALELNKPFHHTTPFGTLVVLYRRVP